MQKKTLKSLREHVCIFLFTLIPLNALAARTGSYAWESTLDKILHSLTGPVAYAISIMAIFVCGLTMAFADLQGGAKGFVQVACGLSISLFASQIVMNFLGFNGALV